MQASANITTGIGMPSRLPWPRCSNPSSPGLHCTTSSSNKRGLPEAGEKQSGRQRREQRRNLGVGDQPAVDEAEHRRQAQRPSASEKGASDRPAPSAAPVPAARPAPRSAKCRCRGRSRRSPSRARECRAPPRSAAASAYSRRSESRAGQARRSANSAAKTANTIPCWPMFLIPIPASLMRSFVADVGVL